MTAVLVTRPAGHGDRLVAVLEAHGLRALAVPTVVVAALGDTTELDWAIASMAAYDWLVVTSVSAADLVLERRSAAASPRAARPRVALAAGGLRAELVADQALASSLGTALARRTAPGTRILLLRAATATPDLPAVLRGAGAEVDDVVAYRTIIAPASSRGPLRAALAYPDLGCVVVASGSAVRGLVALTDNMAALVAVPLVAIGPQTAVVAREARFARVWTAASTTTDGLLEAVRQSLISTRFGVPA